MPTRKKQQQIDLQDIETKHLRWVAEVIADGTEIRSLAGRSARLGDGTSRNPPDRDALIAQRIQDLEGRMGQWRRFSLDGFLEDYEQGESAFPWALPSESGPEEEQQTLPGANPTVKRSRLHASPEGGNVDAVVIAALEGLPVTA